MGSAEFLKSEKTGEEAEIDTRLLWGNLRSDKRLCLPAVLQGKWREISKSSYGQKESTVQFAFDLQERKKVGLYIHQQYRSEDTYGKFVVDMAKMVAYSANEKNKTCFKMQYDVQFRCLPNATLLGQEIFGTVLATELYQMTGSHSATNISIVRESGGYLPVMKTAVLSDGPHSYMAMTQYFDLRKRIDDPKIFDIPDYCQKGTMQPEVHPHIMKYVNWGLFHG